MDSHKSLNDKLFALILKFCSDNIEFQDKIEIILNISLCTSSAVVRLKFNSSLEKSEIDAVLQALDNHFCGVSVLDKNNGYNEDYMKDEEDSCLCDNQLNSDTSTSLQNSQCGNDEIIKSGTGDRSFSLRQIKQPVTGNGNKMNCGGKDFTTMDVNTEKYKSTSTNTSLSSDFKATNEPMDEVNPNPVESDMNGIAETVISPETTQDKSSHGAGKLSVHCCEDCDCTFKTEQSLTRHKTSHNDKRGHLCCICGKQFKLLHTLKNHLKTHADTHEYVCSMCEKRFKQREGLLAHERCHSDTREHICQLCKSTFKSRNRMLTHVRLVHNRSDAVECRICGDAFKSKYVLKRHLEVKHTMSEHVWQCTDCMKTFPHKDYLKTHLRKVHGTVKGDCTMKIQQIPKLETNNFRSVLAKYKAPVQTVILITQKPLQLNSIPKATGEHDFEQNPSDVMTQHYFLASPQDGAALREFDNSRASGGPQSPTVPDMECDTSDQFSTLEQPRSDSRQYFDTSQPDFDISRQDFDLTQKVPSPEQHDIMTSDVQVMMSEDSLSLLTSLREEIVTSKLLSSATSLDSDDLEPMTTSQTADLVPMSSSESFYLGPMTSSGVDGTWTPGQVGQSLPSELFNQSDDEGSDV